MFHLQALPPRSQRREAAATPAGGGRDRVQEYLDEFVFFRRVIGSKWGGLGARRPEERAARRGGLPPFPLGEVRFSPATPSFGVFVAELDKVMVHRTSR